MVKAGSLLYAIYVCLIIAILCSGLVYLFTAYISKHSREQLQASLIDRCESCFTYFLAQSQQPNNDKGTEIKLFEDGITCTVSRVPWGMYERVVGKAYFKKDTIRSCYIVGAKRRKEMPALYACDYGEEIKVSGTAQIIGAMQLPELGYEIAHIGGNEVKNNPVIRGKIGRSASKLPPLREIPRIASTEKREIPVRGNRFSERNIYQSFQQPLREIFVAKGENLDGLQARGHVIIRSADTLYINKETLLEDVIIQAPKVVIGSGFRGSIQVLADKEIEIGTDVILSYPSCLIIPASGINTECNIHIAKGATIYGGVVMDSKNFEQSQQQKVIIEEKAVITGDVYVDGLLQLEGVVRGSVYVHKFELITESAQYEDMIFNGVITTEDIPADFAGLPLFDSPKNNGFERIKQVQ
ncbi:hypothetical protein ACFSTE_13385 [Aquimarina hainanensis]|uniref:Polymer-forming cytoskeletal protein n=1 Tax=Aquimarina hainanensis TaxID=1578017 RepID=A0ABW5NAD0_9FLAO